MAWCGGCKRKKKFWRIVDWTIHANDREANSVFGYPNNMVATTRYTLYTFLPKNLYEQFRRYQNIYFLVVAIVTTIPGVAPISPYSYFIPFLLIIVTAAVKEAWEDIKRWQSDKEVNNRDYEIIRGDTALIIQNQLVEVGDILYLKENEEVPADCVILTSSDPQGLVYVETANLDGETNLKLFKSHSSTAHIKPEDIPSFRAVLRVKPPESRLYEFQGNMSIAEGVLDQQLSVEKKREKMKIKKKASELLTKKIQSSNRRKLSENSNPADSNGELYSIGENNISLNEEKGKEKDFPINDDSTREEDDLLPLNDKQLLMRGVRLRNTKWCYAVVIYAGKNTKLMLNQISPPSKFSRTEWKINRITIFVFSLIMTVTIACTIASAVIDADMWYIPAESGDWLIVFAAYFVLLSFWIPITLFVNLEIVKVAQAGFMMADDQMKLNGEPMRVKNSNLNDELSKVSYIFSDKTGTLTQNKMVFSRVSLGGKKYDDAGTGGLKKRRKEDPAMKELLIHMALNHEVLPEDKGEDVPVYQAPTPDEIALVKGAYLNGIQVRSRTTQGLILRDGNKGNGELYEVLDALEFTSERKRSSVVVRMPTGQIIMFMKGADSAIIPRLSGAVKEKEINIVKQHLTQYSVEGLRTLIFTRKELSESEYKKFHKDYVSAQAALENRADKMKAVMDDIERDFELQGCTAIEDRLQDGVPWAIDYFIKAGVKVWMITGDKQETAENIARSCKLTGRETYLTRVVNATSMGQCEEMLRRSRKDVDDYPKVTLVMDGMSLVFALDESLQSCFQEVGKLCETVVCCRCDPLQKAQVVRMMKQATGDITLSIGDGANDVSMLQEAHVGVGIWGKEGTQAARNSDYAIRQFSHLPRLVAVHGRYNMVRNALLIQYSFYKNIVVFGSHFWFGFFNLFSGQTYLDDWIMALFNEAMTSLGPLSMAFFEKDLSERLIMKYPQVYKELRSGLYLTTRTFGNWLLSSLWHGLVIFFCIFLVPDIVTPYGITTDMWLLSTYSILCGVIVVVLRGALSTRLFVVYSHAAYWFSITFDVFGILFIESQLLWTFPRYYKVMDHTFTTGFLWFIIMVVVVICLAPDVAVMYFVRQVYPKNWQIIQELGKMESPLDDDNVELENLDQVAGVEGEVEGEVHERAHTIEKKEEKVPSKTNDNPMEPPISKPSELGLSEG